MESQSNTFTEILSKVAAGHAKAFLVDHSEIASGEIEHLDHIHGSKDFSDDLTLHKHAWIYLKDHSRCLVLQQNLK